MKDNTESIVIEECVGLKPKLCSFLVDENSEYKKAKSLNRNVVASISHIWYKDVFWIINVWKVQWIEFKIKIIEQKLMKSVKFHCLVLMTKYIFKTMDMTE